MVYDDDDDDKDVCRFEVGHLANISLVMVYGFLKNVLKNVIQNSFENVRK